MFMVTHQNLALCYKKRGVVTKVTIPNQREYESEAKLRETSKYLIASKRREEAKKRNLATFKGEGEIAASRIKRSNSRWGRN